MDKDRMRIFVKEAIATVQRSRVAIVVITGHLIDALRIGLNSIDLHCDVLRADLTTRREYRQSAMPVFFVLREEELETCGKCSKLVLIADESLPESVIEFAEPALDYYLRDSLRDRL